MGRRVQEGWEKLEVAKRESVGQLLLKCARLLDERAVARVNREGGAQARLRPAHTRLVPHIEPEGTRLTELARRLGITKQAVGQVGAQRMSALHETLTELLEALEELE